MGAWGYGLFDNDTVLDFLEEPDGDQGFGGLPSHQRPTERVGFFKSLFRKKPQPTEGERRREAQVRPLVHDPESSPKADAFMYVGVPEDLVQADADHAAERLDAFLTGEPESLEEREGELGYLAIVLLCWVCGATVEADRVARWRAAYEAVLARTPDDDDYYAAVAENVRAGFDLLHERDG